MVRDFSSPGLKPSAGDDNRRYQGGSCRWGKDDHIVCCGPIWIEGFTISKCPAFSPHNSRDFKSFKLHLIQPIWLVKIHCQISCKIFSDLIDIIMQCHPDIEHCDKNCSAHCQCKKGQDQSAFTSKNISKCYQHRSGKMDSAFGKEMINSTLEGCLRWVLFFQRLIAGILLI